MNNCQGCAEVLTEDEVVWVDAFTGKASMLGEPYCVGCAPEERNYETN